MLAGPIARPAARRRKPLIHGLHQPQANRKITQQRQARMRSDQIPGLFQLEWQHCLLYHYAHLVGSVCVVFEQLLSIRINEVFQLLLKKNPRQSRISGFSQNPRLVLCEVLRSTASG
jgi:hypothetical protein